MVSLLFYLAAVSSSPANMAHAKGHPSHISGYHDHFLCTVGADSKSVSLEVALGHDGGRSRVQVARLVAGDVDLDVVLKASDPKFVKSERGPIVFRGEQAELIIRDRSTGKVSFVQVISSHSAVKSNFGLSSTQIGISCEGQSRRTHWAR